MLLKTKESNGNIGTSSGQKIVDYIKKCKTTGVSMISIQ